MNLTMSDNPRSGRRRRELAISVADAVAYLLLGAAF
jgi:hypothetical protein